ncbi:MAG: lysophospholipid acyltransferase family protein [Candidatus Kapabacteria bacterium]|nr:lysophospholipid acyltransferase family protein [Candidatus Kapabacteria bacterium]
MLTRLDSSRYAITRDNVRKAFPEAQPNVVDEIVRSAYGNLGITLIELLAMSHASKQDILARIAIPGIDVLERRAARGEPSVLMSGHYGNWELLALAGALMAKVPFTIVVHPQHNAKADKFLNAIRTRFGNIIVPMGQAARPLVTAMQKGGTVAFLADQYADPLVNRPVVFFGRETPTFEAPAALALRYKAPMFAAYAQRQSDGTYVAPFHEIPSADLDASAEGIAELTRRHVLDLEDIIRAEPGQWSWQHRRWRT